MMIRFIASRRAVTAAAILLSSIVVGTAWASGTAEPAAFPTRPVAYVIPFDPGGQSDVTALYQKPILERELGVAVTIRHQPGAGGAVAWSSIARSRGDGYTVVGSNLPHIIIQPLVRGDAGYTTEQLKPVYLFQTTPIGLAVAKDSPINSLSEFIEYARANPGRMTISGSGTHSGHHLAVLQMQHMTGTEFTYIPATGAAPSVTNFLGGHTMALMANSDDLVTHAAEIKVLAIGTEERFAHLPNVPTFIEQGLNMTAGIDRGVSVPPDTPDEIVARLEQAFDAATRDPELRARLESLGFVTRTLGSRAYGDYLRQKAAETAAILRELGEIQ